MNSERTSDVAEAAPVNVNNVAVPQAEGGDQPVTTRTETAHQLNAAAADAATVNTDGTWYYEFTSLAAGTNAITVTAYHSTSANITSKKAFRIKHCNSVSKPDWILLAKSSNI